MDLEVAGGERRLQLAPQLEALERGRVHPCFVELEPALAERLGRVHRRVSVAQELLGGLSVLAVVPSGAERDADARFGEDLALIEREGLAKGGEDPLGDAPGAGRIGLLDEDAELVSAEPGRRVLQPQAGSDPLRHGGQELVSGRVAEAVVHDLEVVEIDEEDGELARPGDDHPEPAHGSPDPRTARDWRGR